MAAAESTRLHRFTPVAGLRSAWRWAVLVLAFGGGVAVGTLETAPAAPDGMLNMAFTPGITFDVP